MTNNILEVLGVLNTEVNEISFFMAYLNLTLPYGVIHGNIQNFHPPLGLSKFFPVQMARRQKHGFIFWFEKPKVYLRPVALNSLSFLVWPGQGANPGSFFIFVYFLSTWHPLRPLCCCSLVLYLFFDILVVVAVVLELGVVKDLIGTSIRNSLINFHFHLTPLISSIDSLITHFLITLISFVPFQIVVDCFLYLAS